MKLTDFAIQSDAKLDDCIYNETHKLEELHAEIIHDFKDCLCANIGEKLTKYDDFYCHKIKPKHIKVYRSKEPRTYIGVGGKVTYYRREYLDTRTMETFHLIDDAINLEKAHRITKNLKAKVLSLRQSLSCREVSKALFGHVSRQSVCKILRDCIPDNISYDFCALSRATVSDIFVEADEAHAVLANGSRCCINLVYVHEGYISSGGSKNTLKNPFYISQPAHKNIWISVLEYVQNKYPADVKIHVRGDGANWIKAALNYLPNSDFKLDKFHTMKAIKTIAKDDKYLQRRIYQALENHSHFELVQCYDIAIKNDLDKLKIQAFDYLQNNLKYIDFSEENRCSAEGHISHIYASKMSSRPCSWSKKGLLKFAMLRTLLYSKIDIKSLFEKSLKFIQ